MGNGYDDETTAEPRDDLPAAYTQALGEIMSSFQRLEQVVQLAYVMLSGPGTNVPVQILLNKMSFRKLIDSVIALYDWVFPMESDPRPVRDAFKACYQVEDQRNTYIHSHWGVDIENNSSDVIRMKAGRSVFVHVNRVDLSELRDFRTKIDEVAERILKHAPLVVDTD